MANIDGRRVLAGAWGLLRVDNLEFSEVVSVNVDITIEREDVQWGLGKESKVIAVTGEGTLNLDKVYTRFAKQYKEILKGKDVRFDLYLKEGDPDSVGGQIETYFIQGAWLNTFNLGFEKAAKGSREYTFGFNVQNSSFNDIIK